MTHVLRYAARTDRGLLRANNQDSVFAGDRLLVIADGMGGHAAGDVASRLVVAAFVDLDEMPQGSDMVRPLTEATRNGNAAIAEMVEKNPDFDGMGTTLTALLFDGSVVALAHVGDSRAYLYRNGVLHQISHDDTFVQSLVDDGRITADEAAHHPQRSLLLRALNGTEMDPSVTLRETSAGDRFLICSDGLSDVVSPESIADALAGPDPDQVADTLIQLALVGGGPDNVTVIVADVVETGPDGHFGIPAGGVDPEATGPMQPIHLTQKMPRVPLPPIPEDVPAKPEYAPAEETDVLGADSSHGHYEHEDDDFDDEDSEHPHDGVASAARPEAFALDRASASPAGRRMVSGPPGLTWGRRGAFALALLVLVGVALSGSYLWASSKYYVGENGEQVAVFKGVNGGLLGWRFASVAENSCGPSDSPCTPLKVDDLVQAARDQVSAGIPVGTLGDARDVITRLTSQQLPPCPTGSSPAATGGGSAAASSGVLSKSSGVPPRTTSPNSSTGPSAGTSPVATRSSATTGPARRSTNAPDTAGRPTRPLPAVPPAVSGKSPTGLMTVTIPPPTPVTTTMTVTVLSSSLPGSGVAGVGQRLRAHPPLGAPAITAGSTPPRITRPTPARTTPGTTAARKPPTTSAAKPTAVGKPVRTTTAGPRTRPLATLATPTVTVVTTVTSLQPTVSAPVGTATPLVPPAAEPGVTCRPLS